MDKSAIKNFSIEARKILMRSAETEAGFYGVTRIGCKSPIQKGNDFEVYETLAGTENRIYGADIKKRENLVEAVETLGFDQVIEETAYTWFNRIIAIRFMEVNGYLPTRVRVLSSETGSNTPDIISQSLDVDLNMTSVELEKVQKAKEENRYDDAFRMLFVKQCNELNAILPGLFEKTDDYMELLLKLSYTSDGVVRMLADTVAEDNFNVETEGQVEIIGWMYQYYNTELKDDTFAKLKKNVKITKEHIPAATQLFTPDWIVRYMVENSVGRVWIEHLRAMDSSIDEKAKAEEFGWKYYLPEAEQETEVQEKLVEIRKSYLSLEPKDITCIDPCMGSGHILVYMFDVLMDIYRSEGFSERDATFSILDNNIRGLDIDRRAYQLSYFALMMKARGYNRLFFRGYQCEDGNIRVVEPVVFAIEESNDINREQLKYFGADLNESDRNKALNQMRELLNSLLDAKEYGSILNIDNYDWNLLRKYIVSESTDGQISFETFGIDNTQKKLLNLIKQSCIMAEKYLVVSTNPPYMGINNGNTKLNSYVKKYYPLSKADLFGVFIEKCSNMLKTSGYKAMITQHVWMFLASFDSLRKKIFENTIISMAHLGTRAFEEISGEVVQTTAWIEKKCKVNEYRATFSRLVDEPNQNEKEKAFLGKTKLFISMIDGFYCIPGNPIAYWLSEKAIVSFEAKKLENSYEARNGITTGQNDLFIRAWFEIVPDENKWFKCNKGGGFRKWYGNQEFVIEWQNDGEKMRNLRDENGKTRATLRSIEYKFKPAITMSRIVSGCTSFRYIQEGFITEGASNNIYYSDNSDYFSLLGFLNSKVCDYILHIYNPTINVMPDDLRKLPIVVEKNERIERLVNENIEICKDDWDDYEKSWDFIRHPLVFENFRQDIRIIDLYEQWKLKCFNRFNQLKKNEVEINEFYIEAYGMEEELSPDVSDDMISARKADLMRDIKSLISYAVGCMLGRFSLDQAGVIYPGNSLALDDGNKSFLPDIDGIIPITDTEYFEDDLVSRFYDFVHVAYGDKYFEENIEFISNNLGAKGQTPRNIIRNYFIYDFYKDHCNLYSVTGSGKRPIYWLFDSGKENGFKCLIYMHRYTKDTLNLIRSEYLHKTEDAVENALKNVEYIIQTSTSAVEKAKATKDRDKYVKQINEMRIYYQALSHLAIKKIEIDLDDGVKNNYQLFQGIEVIADGGKKQKVDLLAKI